MDRADRTGGDRLLLQQQQQVQALAYAKRVAIYAATATLLVRSHRRFMAHYVAVFFLLNRSIFDHSSFVKINKKMARIILLN